MRKGEEDQGTKLVRYVLSILIGGGVALLVCLLFLLICSVGISKGWLGEDLMYQLTIVGCVLGGFGGGMIAVKRCGARALIIGGATGAVFFLLLLTIGLLLFDAAAMEEGGLGLLCGALCGGAAAALLGGKRTGKKKRPGGGKRQARRRG